MSLQIRVYRCRGCGARRIRVYQYLTRVYRRRIRVKVRGRQAPSRVPSRVLDQSTFAVARGRLAGQVGSVNSVCVWPAVTAHSVGRASSVMPAIAALSGHGRDWRWNVAAGLRHPRRSWAGPERPACRALVVLDIISLPRYDGWRHAQGPAVVTGLP